VTLRAAVIETVQVGLVPEQSPDQPSNFQFVAGDSVRVTVVLFAYGFAHVLPQLIVGLASPVTVPDPYFVTVSGQYVVPVKVAVTDRDWFMVTVQVVDMPEQLPPDQPVNDEVGELGVAVSVTDVVFAYPTSQVVPVLPLPMLASPQLTAFEFPLES